MTAMTYREVALGLHYDTHLYMHSLPVDDSYCYANPPIIVLAPTMNDLNYFPHHVLVLGQECTSCLYQRMAPVTPRSRDRLHLMARLSVQCANTYPRSKPPIRMPVV
jgi:hypothetical protein